MKDWTVNLVGGSGVDFVDQIENANSEQIDRFLNHFRSESGSFRIEKDPQPEFGPFNIEVYSDIYNHKQSYLIMLGEYEEDWEVNVRTPYNMNNPHDEVPFFGGLWGCSRIVDNFDFLVTVIKEFAATGNVSTYLLPNDSQADAFETHIPPGHGNSQVTPR